MKKLLLLFVFLLHCNTSLCDEKCFVNSLCDTSQKGYNTHYLCIPFYDCGVKKVLVISYFQLQFKFVSSGYTASEFRHYITNKLISNDTINNIYIDSAMKRFNVINFGEAEAYFNNTPIENIIKKYYKYERYNLFRPFNFDSNNKLELSLVYKLFKSKIIANTDYSGIQSSIYLGCSGYANIRKQFSDALYDTRGDFGYYICLPFYENGERRIVAIVYERLESIFLDNGFTREQFREYIIRKVQTNDTISWDYNQSNFCSIITEKKAKSIFKGIPTAELLHKYYDKKSKVFSVGDGEWKTALINRLFKEHILIYHGYEETRCNTYGDLDFSEYKDLNVDE